MKVEGGGPLWRTKFFEIGVTREVALFKDLRTRYGLSDRSWGEDHFTKGISSLCLLTQSL